MVNRFFSLFTYKKYPVPARCLRSRGKMKPNAGNCFPFLGLREVLYRIYLKHGNNIRYPRLKVKSYRHPLSSPPFLPTLFSAAGFRFSGRGSALVAVSGYRIPPPQNVPKSASGRSDLPCHILSHRQSSVHTQNILSRFSFFASCSLIE